MIALTAVVLAGSVWGSGMPEPRPERRIVSASLEDECSPCGHAQIACRHLRRGGLVPAWAADGGEQPEGVGGACDVLHYDLDIAIDPTLQTINGRNIIRFKSLTPGLTSVQIQLDVVYSVSASISGGAVAATRVAQPAPPATDPRVNITLDRAYGVNEEFEVRVDYGGTAPTASGFGSIVFTTQGGQPLVSSLSEPYLAHKWWPVKEDSNDKATGDMAYTVPATMSVAANGLLQGIDTLAGGLRKHRWKTNYPTAPYLFSFSATNYNQFSDVWTHAGGSMPVQFFVWPGSDTPALRGYWLTTKDMLTAYSARYGLYPFAAEKYGLYQFSFGGGMEHQTMTGQTVDTSPNAQYQNEYLSAHELGHQWWGDMVTCATWSDIWLNEGFATYSEALWFESHGRPASPSFGVQPPGPASLKTHMATRRPSSVNGTVYFTRADPQPTDPTAINNDINRIFSNDFSYRKPGWVLHMLRHAVGDTAFFAMLAEHRSRHLYATATTADFQDACEDVLGQDLDWFFNQWIYQPGAPLYSYGWRNVSAAGRNYVELYLQQTQSASYPTFDMPLDVVTSAGGPSATNVVRNNARAEHLMFQVAAPITTLALDPDNWVLTASNTTPNYGKTAVSFVEGPPKIVDVSPAPGATTALGGPSVVTATFHRPVNTSAGHYTLTRNGAPVAFAFTYNAGSMQARLTPTGLVRPGTYTLTVSAAVTGQTGGLALDGETADPMSAASLPTGDGLPGGAATFRFIVPTCSAADIATEGDPNPLAGPDGFVTGLDFDVFVQAYFTALANGLGALLADITDGSGQGAPDGFLTGTDFDKFVELYFAGC